MKRILVLLVIVLITSVGWKHDCEHIFTLVVSKEIRLQLTMAYSVFYKTWEGSDIICVKCLHRTKQVLISSQPIYPWIYRGIGKLDTTFARSSSDTVYLPLR